MNTQINLNQPRIQPSSDFFTIPTTNFRVLYCFIVLLHGRRKIVHFNVTTNPTAA